MRRPLGDEILRTMSGTGEKGAVGGKKRPALARGDDMRRIRALIPRNCERFAEDPVAASTAMNVLLTLRRTATNFQMMAEAYTRDFDLSPAKVTVVMALLATEGHTLAQGEIGRQLAVSLGNLTALVATLEDAGIIKRRQDPSDGRVTNIALTPKGLALAKRFAPIHYKTVAAAVSGLSLSEQRTLIDLLDKMRGKLQQP